MCRIQTARADRRKVLMRNGYLPRVTGGGGSGHDDPVSRFADLVRESEGRYGAMYAVLTVV